MISHQKARPNPIVCSTSRAEYRLHLRQDNADERLSKLGYDLGLLPGRNYAKYLAKQDAIQHRIDSSRVKLDHSGTVDSTFASSRGSLSRSSLAMSGLEMKSSIRSRSDQVCGYIDRQNDEVKRFNQLEEKEIPRLDLITKTFLGCVRERRRTPFATGDSICRCPTAR